jgi:hypothetical protein
MIKRAAKAVYRRLPGPIRGWIWTGYHKVFSKTPPTEPPKVVTIVPEGLDLLMDSVVRELVRLQGEVARLSALVEQRQKERSAEPHVVSRAA